MKKQIGIILLLLTSLTYFAQGNLMWTTMNTGTTKKINDIYFHTPDTGYIVGDNYLFKKTTDGGLTWINLTAPTMGERPGNNGRIIAIDYYLTPSFSHPDSGLYLTWEKGYHGVSTPDEGLTYNRFNYDDTTQFCTISGFSILPHNRGNGYTNLLTYGENCNGNAVFHNYFDGPFAIWKSDTTFSTNSARFTSADVDNLALILGHSDGYLLKYASPFSIPDSIFLDNSGVSAVAYAGNNTWFAYTNKGFQNMYISVDSGKTFVNDTSFSPSVFQNPLINEFSFSANNIGIGGGQMYVNSGAIVVRDSNRWDLYITQHPINTVKLFGNGKAFAAGDSGLFMTTTISTSIKDVNRRNNILQINPNPVNDFLQLNGFDNSIVDNIQLFDINGKFIQEFSVFERRLNVTLLKEGTYIIRVRAEGKQFSQKVIIQ